MTMIAASLGLGLVFGVLRPVNDELLASLQQFAATFSTQHISHYAIYESLLRYGRPLLLIWACALFPKLRHASLLVLYMRAMSLGFSASMMVLAFGARGFLAAMALNGLQNIIIMPVYAYTTYNIIISRHDKRLMAAGLTAVVLASIIEVYISPTLFRMVVT